MNATAQHIVIKSYSGDRKPDIVGTQGRAWEWKLDTAQRPAMVSTWLLDAPSAHPMWKSYLVAIVHLRAIDGAPPAKIHEPGATHEVVVMALNPDHEPNPDKPGPIAYLSPANLVSQVTLGSDHAGKMLVRRLVEAFCIGELSPDTDWWQHQLRWLERTVAEIRRLQ